MMVRILSVLGVLVTMACGGAVAEGPAPVVEPPVAAAPVEELSPVVSSFDLIPATATAAAFIDLTTFRDSDRGRRIIEAMRRAGGGDWEQLVAVDLDSGVRRLLWFSLSDREALMPVDVLRSPTGGVIVELEGDEPCRTTALAATSPEPIVAPAGEMDLRRCGNLIWLSCRECQIRPVAAAGVPAVRAIDGLRRGEGGRLPTAALVASSEIYGRARCERASFPLSGWHAMVVDFAGEGATFVGRIGAAGPEHVAALEECVADGMSEAAGELGGIPGMSRLGIPAIVGGAVVSRDTADQKVVTVTLELDANESELMMSLIDLLADGGMP